MTTTTIEEKTSRLIANLVEKTQQGRVVWEKTLSEYIYRAQFEGDAVFIRENQPVGLRKRTYSLSIRNGDGQVLEVMRQAPDEKYYDSLAQMFVVSKGAADRYTEESLDRLLQELESR